MSLSLGEVSLSGPYSVPSRPTAFDPTLAWSLWPDHLLQTSTRPLPAGSPKVTPPCSLSPANPRGLLPLLVFSCPCRQWPEPANLLCHHQLSYCDVKLASCAQLSLLSYFSQCLLVSREQDQFWNPDTLDPCGRPTMPSALLRHYPNLS